MAKKHRKGSRRRANSPARGRHPKGAEEGPQDRVKRNDREEEIEHRRQHQAIAPDGGKAKTPSSGGAKVENPQSTP